MNRYARLVLAVALFSFISLNAFAQCGVERWSIKTGTDSGASSIPLSTWTSSTIYNFSQSTRPATIPSSSRVAPRETTQYSVSGTLIKYKREDDSDYHLVIQDGAGRQMIIEIPSPNCVGGGSPWGSRISTARSQFDSRFTATTSFKTTSTAITVRGIGFWDFLHGQTGALPNGLEVHPVLNVSFPAAAVASPIEFPDAAEPEPKLPDGFVRDNDGGLVQLYRGGAAVADAVLYHGGEVIEEPSLQVVFAGDWTSEQLGSQRASILQMARRFNFEPGVDALDRYGFKSRGVRVSSVQLDAAAVTNAMTNDLDVQRLLANAVESGQLQHLDESAIVLVMLAPGMAPAVGSTSDYLSYHSQFHPSDLAMRYVVVRGGLDAKSSREAALASIARAIVNPNGNGWF